MDSEPQDSTVGIFREKKEDPCDESVQADGKAVKTGAVDQLVLDIGQRKDFGFYSKCYVKPLEDCDVMM